MPIEPDSVEAIVVAFRSRNYIDDCLRSLFDQGIKNVWVVDNASDDGIMEHIREKYPEVRRIANNVNYGFGAANNKVLKMIKTPYALLLNPDAWMGNKSLAPMLKVMEEYPRVAVVGPRVLKNSAIVPNLCLTPRWRDVWFFIVTGMRWYYAGGFTGRAVKGYPWENGDEGDHIMGECMLVRMEAMKRAGYFDERYFLYFEETELCLRLRKLGWRVRMTSKALVYHKGNASVATETSLPSLEYMRSAILFWNGFYSCSSAIFLRLTLGFVAALKILLLLAIPGKRSRRVWLKNVMRMVINPYSVPLTYHRAYRPTNWPKVKK